MKGQFDLAASDLAASDLAASDLAASDRIETLKTWRLEFDENRTTRKVAAASGG